MSPPIDRIWKLGFSVVVLLPAVAQNVTLENLVAQGRELESQGEFAKADQLFRAAYRQVEHSSTDPLVTAAVLDCLASTAADQGNYMEAERLLLRTLSIAERAAGRESKAVATVLWHLAGIYQEAGDMAAAEPLLRKYESIVLRNAEGDPSTAAADLENIGRIYAMRHAVKKALTLFQRAVDLLEKLRDPSDVDMARALLDRAGALGLVGELDSALADVQRASVLVTRFPHPFPAMELLWDVTAGIVYARAHRASETETAFGKAIQVAETSYGLTHPMLSLILSDYAAALRLLGKKKEASAAANRAKRIYSANRQSNALGRVVSIQALRP